MKIDLASIDRNQFNVKPININGQELFLVNPKLQDTVWSDQTKVFRSSVWDKDGHSYSLGYRKFVNIGEKPEFEPIDFTQPIDYVQKLDGSLGICNKINKKPSLRTRGTETARSLPNGHEVDLLVDKYSKLFNNDLIDSGEFTLLTEWTSPTNIICLKESDEPKLWLLGVVRHEDYSYFKQDELDSLAAQWDIERPKRYKFVHFDESISFAQNQVEMEGLVLYCNGGQVLKKCKSIFYLKLHRFRSNCNFELILDAFLEFGRPYRLEFIEKLSAQYDFETINHEITKDFINELYQKYNQVLYLLGQIDNYILVELKGLDRKQAALKIIAEIPENFRWVYFEKLSQKPLDNRGWKKLMLTL